MCFSVEEINNKPRGITMKRIKRKKNSKGFSLIELILVLGLGSLVYLGVINNEKRKSEALRAESAGEQYAEVGKALGEYINQNKGFIVSRLTTDGSVVTVPLSVLQGIPAAGVGISTGGTIDLPGGRLLPASFNTLSALNTGYVLQIRNEGIDSLRGVVISDSPVVDGSGAIRYDWLGYAARKAGSAAGVTFFEANRVTGINAGWSLPSANFSAINQAGQLAYRTLYSSNYDAVYLRRDGLYAMTGNINMGNYDIVDATNITFNGWLSGNNAILNNLEVGHIESTTMYNSALMETKVIKGITGLNPNFSDTAIDATPDYGDFAQFSRVMGNYSVNTNFLNRNRPFDRSAVYVGGTDTSAGQNNTARSYVYAGDIRLGENTKNSRPINNWLSDRLPKYVARGASMVTVTATTSGAVPKPNCGGNVGEGETVGIPKIIVTPQEVHAQGAVRGQFQVNASINGAGIITLDFIQNQHIASYFSSYAVDAGGAWNVYLQTVNYEGGNQFVGGKVLAQVFCSYEDV